MATPAVSRLLKEGETYRLMEFSKQSTPSILDEAIGKFNDAIGAIPEASPTPARKEQLAFAHSHLAATQFQKAIALSGDLEKEKVRLLRESVDAFKKAISIKDPYPWAYAHKGQALIYLGVLLLSESDTNGEPFQEAVDSCQKAIDQSQDYAWAYAQKGVAHRWLSQKQTPGSNEWRQSLKFAEEALTKATDLNKDYAWAFANRNVVRERRGTKDQNFQDVRDAWQDLMETITLQPAIVSSFTNRPGGLSPSRIAIHARSFSPSKMEWAREELKQNLDNRAAQYIFALEKAEMDGLEAAREVIEIERGAKPATLAAYGLQSD